MGQKRYTPKQIIGKLRQVEVRSPQAWIGATDEVQEGVWEWVTGEPWVYTYWAPGQPDNNPCCQRYGVIWEGPEGTWDDKQVDNPNPTGFVCEFENR